MVIVDNNILSTFAKIDEIDLFFDIFKNQDIGVTSAVYQEFKHGLELGHSFLEKILTLIEKKTIKLVPLTEKELLSKSKLPTSFDKGESESVIISKMRHYKLVTNEKIVKNYCQKHNINFIDLPGMLRFLWKKNLLSKNRVKELVVKIECQDNIIFKSKEKIFTE
ncbi:MAG: hypothetical protein KAU83_11025 [Bacteroidales bacterium]|nr:hypothetical protein [Bacteroidales bacterium]